MRVYVESTGMGSRVFDLSNDNECALFNTYCRAAVFNFLTADVDVSYINLPQGKKLVITDESSEPEIWLGAAILYMQCKESGDWGDILEIIPIDKDENED